jgi:hypothetical protein
MIYSSKDFDDNIIISKINNQVFVYDLKFSNSIGFIG